MGLFNRKPKAPAREPREINMMRRSWGHNIEIIKWRPGDADAWVWVTPGPEVGDIIIIEGKKGPIRCKVVKSEWTVNVDDMYRLTLVPAEA